MEAQIENLKSYLINNLPDFLRARETEAIKLNDLTENNIIIGTIDINKYIMPVVCSILPNYENDSEITLEETTEALNVTISIIFRQDKYENLVKKMIKYCEALRDALLADYSLANTCINSDIGERRLFLDCGTSPQSATGFEFELTIEI